MEEFHITDESRKKGEETEIRFKEWLDKHNISYVHRFKTQF
jgi:hypothetical protein